MWGNMNDDIMKKLELIESDLNFKRVALERISRTACLKGTEHLKYVAGSVTGDCPHCIACKALGLSKWGAE